MLETADQRIAVQLQGFCRCIAIAAPIEIGTQGAQQVGFMRRVVTYQNVHGRVDKGLQHCVIIQRLMDIIEHNSLRRQKEDSFLARLLHGFLCLLHQLRKQGKIRAGIALPDHKAFGRQ